MFLLNFILDGLCLSKEHVTSVEELVNKLCLRYMMI